MDRIRSERLEKAYPLLLVVATLLLFWGSLSAGFVYDDFPAVVDNPTVQKEQFFAAWTWRPVRHFTLVVDHVLFGDDPAGYHAHSLLWHVLCVLLVYRVSRRIFADAGPAFLTALVFAVHPIHVEAVTGVANRKESLSLAFALMALLGYARFLDGAGPRRWPWALASAFAWIVSLLAKEVSIVLPMALVAYEALCVPPERRFLLRYRGLLAVGGAIGAALLSWLVLRYATDPEVLRSSASLKGYTGELSASAVVLTGARAFFRYLQLLVWPSGLCPDHVVPLSRSLLEPSTALPWLGLLGVVVGAVLLARRAPVAGFGALWLLITYLPVSNLLPASYIVADRYMYAPSFGFAVFGVALGAMLFERLERVDPRLARAAVGIGATAAIGGYAIVAHSYNAAWRNEESFWTYVASCEPRSHKAHNALGILLADRGAVQEALVHYARAIEKGSPNAWFNRGTTLAEAGRHREALRDFERAAELLPHRAQVHFALGNAYLAVERFREASESYTRAIELDGGDAEAYNNRGAAYLRLGDVARARADYERAVALDPSHAPAHYNLAGVQLAVGDREAALRTYEVAAGLGLTQAHEALELLRAP